MQPRPQRLLAARAITLANATSGADTITFDPTVFASAQTITLTSALPAISDDLTITGPGATLATISGNDLYELFYINFGKSLSISGLTLAHGRAASGSGGGIYNSQGSLTVTNSVFDSNVGSGTGGGAIYSIYGTGLSVSGTTFTGNSALYGEGGAIYSYGGPGLSVSSSTFTGNMALHGDGGAVAVISGTTLSVTDSSFSGNTSLYAGGGIYTGSGILTIRDSSFSGNASTSYSGGGIYNTSGGVIIGTTFSANTAVLNGGGLFLNNLSLLQIINSTIAGNSVSGTAAANGGGGLYAHQGSNSTKIINSTIANNSAANAATSGIWLDYNSLTIQNSIVADNNSANNCYFTNGSAITDGGHNLDNGTTCGFGGAVGQNTDPLLSALANNGGTTQTMALPGNSPALDAGSNPLAVDQDGNPLQYDQRGAGFPRISNTTVDIALTKPRHPRPISWWIAPMTPTCIPAPLRPTTALCAARSPSPIRWPRRNHHLRCKRVRCAADHHAVGHPANHHHRYEHHRIGRVAGHHRWCQPLPRL